MATESDSLGDRMKRLERAARTSLPPRMPAILRIDGKAFHTWTRGCVRPFDTKLMEIMDGAALAVCEEAQGAQIAYVQSDEISILLHDYKRFASEAWFDKQVQKLVSVSASIAAAYVTSRSAELFNETRLAAFDARVFVLPEAEVCNLFVWRQQDAVRNSIQMAARAVFSHKECDRKTCSDLQEMLHARGINWNDYPAGCKRGRCVVRRDDGRWMIDGAPPTFSADRAYIERHLAVEPEDPRPAAGAAEVSS